MKIAIVNGRGTAGKSTFEHMVQEIAAARGKVVEIISTIDYVKMMAKNIGWDGNKDAKGRRFLSDLKDSLQRYNDSPHQSVVNFINEHGGEVDLLFVDCREPEEIERFVKEYNALTVLVQRGEMVLLGNHADDNVLNYQYDVTIDNSRGLSELMEEATIFEETFVEND